MFFSSSSIRFVWCKLNKHFFNLDKDVYVCSAYIPPANLVYIKNNFECPFFKLEKSIAKYSRIGEIIMMGEFNARKGKLSYQIDQYVGQHVSEEDDPNLISHKLPNMNTRDLANPNKSGKLLVDFCMPDDLCMLNGRSKGDTKGDFTNYSYKGSSMIDYGIISKSLFPKIVYFKAHNLSFFLKCK